MSTVGRRQQHKNTKQQYSTKYADKTDTSQMMYHPTVYMPGIGCTGTGHIRSIGDVRFRIVSANEA